MLAGDGDFAETERCNVDVRVRASRGRSDPLYGDVPTYSENRVIRWTDVALFEKKITVSQFSFTHLDERGCT